MNLSPCPLRRKLCSVRSRKQPTRSSTTNNIKNDYWKLAVRSLLVLFAEANTPKHTPPPISKLPNI